MDKLIFEKYDGKEVTDELVAEAATLFSNNYGVWGEQAAENMGSFAKAGNS